jgi:hypothetical protein
LHGRHRISATAAANRALFAAAILLTPLAFLLSTRSCRQISDILALVLGIALLPLVSCCIPA